MHRGRRLASFLGFPGLLAVIGCGEKLTPPPAPPAAIAIVSGDLQTGIVGTRLPDLLVVRITDTRGAPVVGVPVSFTVTGGNGAVAADTAITDPSGFAVDSWWLGTSSADTQRVTTRIAVPTPVELRVTFHATARPGPPAVLHPVAGEGQDGLYGAPLAESLSVRVTDLYGNPVSRDTVRWAAIVGGGSISPASVLSDTNGLAKASWTLGALGSNVARASADKPGVIPGVFGATATRIIWRDARGKWTWSSPAVGSDGTVFYGRRDSTLRAVNQDGTLRWSYPVPDGIIDDGPSLGPTGDVYFAVYPGHSLYALRPDGTLRWRFDTGTPVRSTPAVGADGTVYALAISNGLFAIDPSGAQRWFQPTPGASDDSPVVGPDGTIYVPAAMRGRLYAISPADSVRWVLSFPGDTINNDLGTPAVGPDGTVYLLAQDKQLYAIDPTGVVKWSVPLGTGFVAAKAPPAVASNGVVYVGGFDRGLWAVSSTGSVLWSTGAFPSSYVFGSPAIAADGTIYFVDVQGILFAVDASGAQLWTQATCGQTVASPAIGSDGTVYFGSSCGGLAAIKGIAPLVSGGWPMFMHDLSHSGRKP